MSRWRPPPERSTALITRAGHDRLKAELDELWHQRRPEVVRALAAAAAEGDRSENAEYTYRKKQLAEIDRRVRYLSKRLPALRVVENTPADPERIYFGAWIELTQLDTDQVLRLRIVGPDETQARSGRISVDSPLARAAMNKRVDDEFEAQLPAGAEQYLVLAVHYGDRPPPGFHPGDNAQPVEVS